MLVSHLGLNPLYFHPNKGRTFIDPAGSHLVDFIFVNISEAKMGPRASAGPLAWSQQSASLLRRGTVSVTTRWVIFRPHLLNLIFQSSYGSTFCSMVSNPESSLGPRCLFGFPFGYSGFLSRSKISFTSPLTDEHKHHRKWMNGSSFLLLIFPTGSPCNLHSSCPFLLFPRGPASTVADPHKGDSTQMCTCTQPFC